MILFALLFVFAIAISIAWKLFLFFLRLALVVGALAFMYFCLIFLEHLLRYDMILFVVIWRIIVCWVFGFLARAMWPSMQLAEWFGSWFSIVFALDFLGLVGNKFKVPPKQSGS